MQANLPFILAQVRAAAGPDVPILGMTYYNPFAVLWFDDPVYAEAVSDAVEQFNALLDAIYAAAGSPVAQVDDEFAVGVFPQSALLACEWTWMCDAGDIHANTAGYSVIAQAFLDVLDQ